MLADPEIEAVYNPLPKPFCMCVVDSPAEAGKHVLCESRLG